MLTGNRDIRKSTAKALAEFFHLSAEVFIKQTVNCFHGVVESEPGFSKPFKRVFVAAAQVELRGILTQ